MADFILSSLSSSSLSFSQNNIIKLSLLPPHITLISPSSSSLFFSLQKQNQSSELTAFPMEWKKEKEEQLPCLEHEIFKAGLGEWKEREKEERKEEKNPLFQPQNGYFLLSREKKVIPRTPVFPRDQEEKRKGKGRRKGWLQDKIFKRDSGEKGWKKGREKNGKNALFQSFRGAFLSPEERRNPVVSREGEGKEEREKR